MIEYSAINDFWFKELTPQQWFMGGEAVDTMVRERFEAVVNAALDGQCDHWTESLRGRLALILVLDQFTRNIFRGHAKSYAGDAKAQALTLEGIEQGVDQQLTVAERQFFYLPLMHAEDKQLQALSMQKYTELNSYAQNVLKYAKEHQSTIDRFGRFPYRNQAIGRDSTEAEQQFLLSDENPF